MENFVQRLHDVIQDKDIFACPPISKEFVKLYLMLMFLIGFATPVLITTSLNVFIQAAVKNTTYEV